jgi:hypothetical protein
MGEQSDAGCAVWFAAPGGAQYELFGDERDAAIDAAAMALHGETMVLGLQCADGRVVAADDWQAFIAEQDRMIAAERAAPVPERSPTRKVADPFRGSAVEVDVDAPAWLGREIRPND